MRSSSHFVIGHSHDVCQDYAMHDGSFAALSDGCSRVYRDEKLFDAHTEIGAMITVRSLFETRGNYQAIVANQMREELGIEPECLCATAGSVCQDGETFVAKLIGDGMIAARFRKPRKPHGAWRIWRYDYTDNPYYPAYGESMTESPLETDLSSGDQDVAPRYVHSSFPICIFDMAVVASDGVFSFTKDGKSVPFDLEFASRFLEFRSMGGNFMLRHLRGVLNELAAEDIVHQDDISMIALYAKEWE